jgi:hypothetical protein
MFANIAQECANIAQKLAAKLLKFNETAENKKSK